MSKVPSICNLLGAFNLYPTFPHLYHTSSSQSRITASYDSSSNIIKPLKALVKRQSSCSRTQGGDPNELEPKSMSKQGPSCVHLGGSSRQAATMEETLSKISGPSLGDLDGQAVLDGNRWSFRHLGLKLFRTFKEVQ